MRQAAHIRSNCHDLLLCPSVNDSRALGWGATLNAGRCQPCTLNEVGTQRLACRVHHEKICHCKSKLTTSVKANVHRARPMAVLGTSATQKRATSSIIVPVFRVLYGKKKSRTLLTVNPPAPGPSAVTRIPPSLARYLPRSFIARGLRH